MEPPTMFAPALNAPAFILRAESDSASQPEVQLQVDLKSMPGPVKPGQPSPSPGPSDRIRMPCSMRKVLILPQTTTYGTATVTG
eukprot:820975-Rhodomonas_salina.1